MSKHRTAAYLFAAALLLRLLYLYEIADNPFFSSPVVDAFTYSQQAAAIAAGAWLDYAPGAFWQPPLYPWFLGLVHWLAADHFFLAVRLFQAVLGALSCVLLYLLGLRVFERRVAMLGGAAMAVYGPALYFDAELLPVSLAIPLLLATLLLTILATEQRRQRLWLAAGLLLGLAAVNVPTILILTPLLIAWIAFAGDLRLAAQARVRSGLLLVAGLGIAILPVTARNYLHGDDLVLISWNGGVNFYVGNNPDYAASTGIRPGQAWLELIDEAKRAGHKNGSQNSSYFYGRALGFMAAEPLEYAGLVIDKVARFWGGDEIGRNRNIYYFRNYSHLLSASLWKFGLAFPFGIVSPLALAGLFFALRRRGPELLPAAAVLAYAAGVILFFVTARYRLPVVPLLLLFAASAIFWFVDNLGKRSRRALAGAISVLVLAIWSNTGAGAMDMEGDAETFYGLGHAQVEKGKLAAGIRYLEKAARMAPEEAEILVSLGTAHAMAGHYQRAVAVLSRGAGLFPERLDIRFNLGNAHFALRQYARAAEEYAAALALQPGRLDALRLLSRSLVRSGQFEAAFGPYRQLRRRSPREIESHLSLGFLHSQLGHPDSSLVHYRQALRLKPDHPTALLEVGLLLLGRDETSTALEYLTRAVRRQPSAPRAHASLALAHEAREDWGKAISSYREALRLDPDYPDAAERLARLYDMSGQSGGG